MPAAWQFVSVSWIWFHSDCHHGSLTCTELSGHCDDNTPVWKHTCMTTHLSDYTPVWWLPYIPVVLPRQTMSMVAVDRRTSPTTTHVVASLHRCLLTATLTPCCSRHWYRQRLTVEPLLPGHKSSVMLVVAKWHHQTIEIVSQKLWLNFQSPVLQIWK